MCVLFQKLLYRRILSVPSLFFSTHDDLMHRVIYLAYKNEIFLKNGLKFFFLTAIFLSGLFLVKALSISFL